MSDTDTLGAVRDDLNIAVQVGGGAVREPPRNMRHSGGTALRLTHAEPFLGTDGRRAFELVFEAARADRDEAAGRARSTRSEAPGVARLRSSATEEPRRGNTLETSVGAARS